MCVPCMHLWVKHLELQLCTCAAPGLGRLLLATAAAGGPLPLNDDDDDGPCSFVWGTLPAILLCMPPLLPAVFVM